MAGEPNYLDPDVWFDLLRPAHRAGALEGAETDSDAEPETGS